MERRKDLEGREFVRNTDAISGKIQEIDADTDILRFREDGKIRCVSVKDIKKIRFHVL